MQMPQETSGKPMLMLTSGKWKSAKGRNVNWPLACKEHTHTHTPQKKGASYQS